MNSASGPTLAGHQFTRGMADDDIAALAGVRQPRQAAGPATSCSRRVAPQTGSGSSRPGAVALDIRSRGEA